MASFNSAGLLVVLSDSESSHSSSSESSSSSDEDESYVLYEVLFNKLFAEPPCKRPKIVGYVEEVVHMYSEEEVCMPVHIAHVCFIFLLFFLRQDDPAFSKQPSFGFYSFAGTSGYLGPLQPTCTTALLPPGCVLVATMGVRLPKQPRSTSWRSCGELWQRVLTQLQSLSPCFPPPSSYEI